ncbi:hypothetical protein B0T14DRAFT_249244 [Immersiella caudata]|uniref:Uncharacterized protein n=1 Tax=Immersiella caudata TaxID=314043 RepID=A0AA39WJH3_9PEZI|nr:hypothetical protein B0T14DRAFT_249244 [Immersiella caudata]
MCGFNVSHQSIEPAKLLAHARVSCNNAQPGDRHPSPSTTNEIQNALRIGQLSTKQMCGLTVVPYHTITKAIPYLPARTGPRSTKPTAFLCDTSDRVSQPRRPILSRSNQSRISRRGERRGNAPRGMHPRAAIPILWSLTLLSIPWPNSQA